MESSIIYEYDELTKCEFWRDSRTGKVFKFRNGMYQKNYDSYGNTIYIKNGSNYARFRYNSDNKIICEMHVFEKYNAINKNDKDIYRKIYHYDELGKLIYSVDSCGNKEFYDDNEHLYYSIHKEAFHHTLLS